MGAGSVEALVGFAWLVLGTGRGILKCLDWLLTTRAFEGLVQGLWQKLMKEGTRTRQNISWVPLRLVSIAALAQARITLHSPPLGLAQTLSTT